MKKNRVTQLLGIEKPIIQAGMIWTSGWRLASAVSNSGGLGVIGAGSMYPDILLKHIQQCKSSTHKPFAVNLPLLYPDIEQHVKHIINERVPIVFTSAGNPKTWTKTFQEEGIKVVHVVSSAKFALKSQDAGVDAVVAEGFEAGGHNGREETTTLCLIPKVRESIDIPLIAAGGIANGRTMLAVMILGAEAVQIGSRFVCSEEASCHPNFKNAVVEIDEGETALTLKKLTPVRLIKNDFYHQVAKAENEGADKIQLSQILGKARAKKGMFEGDLTAGELEIGQVSSLIKSIRPADEIVDEIWAEFITAKQHFFWTDKGFGRTSI